MNDTWKFNFAYSFTAQEERIRIADGLSRPCLGFTDEVLNATYNTALYSRLGLSEPYNEEAGIKAEDCRRIARYWYWDKPNLEALPQRTAALLFDMCVTHGTREAVSLAQRGFNKCLGIYGAKLRVDGKLAYADITALGNETNRILSSILMERLRFLHDVLGEDARKYRMWRFRCIRLKNYLGVPDDKH